MGAYQIRWYCCMHLTERGKWNKRASAALWKLWSFVIRRCLCNNLYAKASQRERERESDHASMSDAMFAISQLLGFSLLARISFSLLQTGKNRHFTLHSSHERYQLDRPSLRYVTMPDRRVVFQVTPGVACSMPEITIGCWEETSPGVQASPRNHCLDGLLNERATQSPLYKAFFLLSFHSPPWHNSSSPGPRFPSSERPMSWWHGSLLKYRSFHILLVDHTHD